MGRKDRKAIRKADDKEISRLLKTENASKHGAGRKSSATDDLTAKRVTIPPEPRKASSRK